MGHERLPLVPQRRARRLPQRPIWLPRRLSLELTEDHGVAITSVDDVCINFKSCTTRVISDHQAEENDFAIAASTAIPAQPGQYCVILGVKTR